MHTTGWLTVRIQHLRSPDVHQRDEAARVIWDHFEARLRSLVRRRLDYRIRRREDEQDILQSMYASFCHGQLEGNPSPGSRHELWKLLVRIARCKVVNTAKKHLAARRDVRRECTVADRSDASGYFRRRALDPVNRAAARARREALRLRGTRGAPPGSAGRPPPDRHLEAGWPYECRDRRDARTHRPVRRVEAPVDPQAAGDPAGGRSGAGVMDASAVRLAAVLRVRPRGIGSERGVPPRRRRGVLASPCRRPSRRSIRPRG